MCWPVPLQEAATAKIRYLLAKGLLRIAASQVPVPTTEDRAFLGGEIAYMVNHNPASKSPSELYALLSTLGANDARQAWKEKVDTMGLGGSGRGASGDRFSGFLHYADEDVARAEEIEMEVLGRTSELEMVPVF